MWENVLLLFKRMTLLVYTMIDIINIYWLFTQQNKMYSISLQNIHPLTVLEEISAKGHFFSLILRENLKLPSWPFLPHIKHYQQHAPLLAHWWNHSKWSISLIIFFLWFSILLGRGPCILLHHPHSPGIILYVKMGRWIRPICTCLQSNKKVHLIRKCSN